MQAHRGYADGLLFEDRTARVALVRSSWSRRERPRDLERAIVGSLVADLLADRLLRSRAESLSIGAQATRRSDFYDNARVTGSDKSKDVNLYTASVVALDADTGKLRWHYQEVPDDVWDFDSAYESILIDRQIKGSTRKLLVHMNKSGLTFVLDRATGEFLRVFSVPELQNWITGVTEDGKLIGRREPAAGSKTRQLLPERGAGAKSWNQMAYSPRTGLIYMPLSTSFATM